MRSARFLSWRTAEREWRVCPENQKTKELECWSIVLVTDLREDCLEVTCRHAYERRCYARAVAIVGGLVLADLLQKFVPIISGTFDAVLEARSHETVYAGLGR